MGSAKTQIGPRAYSRGSTISGWRLELFDFRGRAPDSMNLVVGCAAYV